VVADSLDDDSGLPDEDAQATAAPDDQKKPKPQTDDQLKKALEVLKNRESKA